MKDIKRGFLSKAWVSLPRWGQKVKIQFFAAAALPTLYHRFEPKFYVIFRQSEVFLNCNIHHTS